MTFIKRSNNWAHGDLKGFINALREWLQLEPIPTDGPHVYQRTKIQDSHASK